MFYAQGLMSSLRGFWIFSLSLTVGLHLRLSAIAAARLKGRVPRLTRSQCFRMPPACGSLQLEIVCQCKPQGLREIPHCWASQQWHPILVELLHPELAELDGVAVVLEADGAGFGELGQLDDVDDALAVGVHGHAVALDRDEEYIPFA